MHDPVKHLCLVLSDWTKRLKSYAFYEHVRHHLRIRFLVIGTIKVYVEINRFKERIFFIVKWQFEIVLSVLPRPDIFIKGRFVVVRWFVIFISWFVIVLVRRSLFMLVIWFVAVLIRRFIVILIWRSVAIMRWIVDVLVRGFIIVLISLLLSLGSIKHYDSIRRITIITYLIRWPVVALIPWLIIILVRWLGRTIIVIVFLWREIPLLID